MVAFIAGLGGSLLAISLAILGGWVAKSAGHHWIWGMIVGWLFAVGLILILGVFNGLV